MSHYFNAHLLDLAKQVVLADILDSDIKFNQDLQSLCPKFSLNIQLEHYKLSYYYLELLVTVNCLQTVLPFHKLSADIWA